MPETSSRLRDTPPPIVDAVVRALVWSGIVASIALPLWLAYVLSANLMMPSTFDAVRERLGDSSSDAIDGAVRIPPAFAEQAARLAKLKAVPGEARGAIHVLHIVGVRISDPRSAPQLAGYHPVRIDTTQAGPAAMLLVAERPIVWQLAVAGTRQRARISIDSSSPFEIDGGHPGILASFRSRAFGNPQVLRIDDIISSDRQRRSSACQEVRTWTEHYGLPLEAVEIRRLADPTHVHLNGLTLETDGTELASSMNAAILCARS